MCEREQVALRTSEAETKPKWGSCRRESRATLRDLQAWSPAHAYRQRPCACTPPVVEDPRLIPAVKRLKVVTRQLKGSETEDLVRRLDDLPPTDSLIRRRHKALVPERTPALRLAVASVHVCLRSAPGESRLAFSAGEIGRRPPRFEACALPLQVFGIR